MKKIKFYLFLSFKIKIFSYELKDSLKEFYDVDTFDTLPLSKYKNKFKKILDKFLLYLLRYLDIKIYYNVFRRKILYQRFYKNVILTIISLLYLLKITILIPKFFYLLSLKLTIIFDTIDEIKRYSLFNHFRFADRSYVISKMLSKKLTNHLI